MNRAFVGPDRRARIVVTFHDPETAFNLQLPWGRVEPARGGSATDVDPKKVAKCFALARAHYRRRERGEGRQWVDLLDYRPDDATRSRGHGPTQGELDHRQRAGFGFRYDYFGARQITLQFRNVQPDVEYHFGLKAPGGGGAVAHDGYRHADWGDGFRDACSWRVVFSRARGFDALDRRADNVVAEGPPTPKSVVVGPGDARRRSACCVVS